MAATVSTRMLILGSGPAGLRRRSTVPAPASSRSWSGHPAGRPAHHHHDVENYPGFADVIQGPWLMEQMQKQAEHVGARMIWDTITDVDFSRRPFRMTGDGGTVYTGETIVIATGAQARWLNLPSEEHLKGRGVSACATCDGFFYRGKKVAVIGGGNTAVEEAIYMTNHSQEVTLIHRRDSLRAEKILQDRLFAHPHINVMWNKEVVQFVGGGQPEGLVEIELRDTRSGEVSRLETEGGFVAIGHSRRRSCSRASSRSTRRLYRGRDRTTRTNIPACSPCGDVMDKVYRQAVTAAGTGCMAALDAERYLAEAEFEASVAA
jgi:thioredoxin reductase (NADPH)